MSGTDDTIAQGNAGLEATVASGPPTSDAGLDSTVAAGGDTGLDATVAAGPDTQELGNTTQSKIAQSLRDSQPTVRKDALDRGDTLGRYVVLDRLGAGGMGEVYSAYDPELDRRIALKVIRPAHEAGATQSAQIRLLDEAKALAKLAHPNVVAIHDVGVYDGDVFLAMEYVEGKSLAAWLDAEKRTWREIVDVVVEAGRGLEAAHAAGLIHRDIKPDNIMVGKDGRVRVLDFGVALAARKGKPQEGSLVGTPSFMAPEQFEGGEVGAFTDQFSLGVTLYQALWKQKPFAGETLQHLLVSVTGGQLVAPPASDVPARVQAAVTKALARDPSARHASLSELLEAIVPPERARWPWIAAAVAVLAIVGVIAIVKSRSSEATPCEGFEGELAGVWDAPRKLAIATALANKPEDKAAIERIVDAYTGQWVVTKTEACRATHVSKAQSAAVLEQRMACLDTRRRELDAVLAVVAAGDSKGVDGVTGLRSLSACNNLAALGHGRPPATLATDDVRAIEDGSARVRALRIAGAYKKARTEAATLIERADKASWDAAAARLLVERGLSESLDGDPRAARETLFEALRRAEAARDDASAAGAWIGLVGVESAGLRQPTEALRWAKHAEVALERAGGDQEQRAMLLHHVGSTLRLLEKHEEGLAKLLESRTLFVHALGQNHYRVAIESGAIANAYRSLGQVDRSITEGEAALAQLVALLGDHHPALGPPLNNLSLAYEELDRLDDAREVLERAIALKEAELGKQHPSLAPSLLNLAGIERRIGRYDVADAMWKRAYDLRVAALGERHADVTRTLNGKLIDRTARGLDAEANELVRDVVARLRSQPDSANELAGALSTQCELFRRANKLDDAKRACDEALKLLGDKPEPNRAVFVVSMAARTAVARKSIPEARDYVNRGRAALEAVTRDKRLARAQLAWSSAYVLQAEGLRPDAIKDAQLARKLYEEEGKTRTFYIDDIDRTFGK